MLRLILPLACVGLLASAPCAGASVAASSDSLDGYRQVLEQGIDSGAYDQIAAGWIDAGKTTTWLLGRTHKPTLHSVFEIGALSEIFTGLALADAAYRGELRLDMPLHEALPDFHFAGRALGRVTLQALATHRAAIRGVPPNLFPVHADDPYAGYDAGALRALLANDATLIAPVGGGYSPLDYALLAQVLGGRRGKDFVAQLHERILAVLKLGDTGFGDSPALLDGHAHGRAVAHWHLASLGAAAGLRSSLSDLLTLLQSNLRPAHSPLRAALLLARQPRSGGGANQVGLGWRISELSDARWPLIWRASRTGGFSAFLGYRSDSQQALVLLGNTDADLSAVGLAWLRHADPPAPPEPAAHRVVVADLDQYAGLYQVSDGSGLIVRHVASGLSAQWAGQPAASLFAVAADVFVADDSSLTLSFQRQAGAVASVVASRAGIQFLAQRLSHAAPYLQRKPVKLPVSALRDAVGCYRLDDATLVRIRLHDGSLSAQLTAREAQPLISYAVDHFATADDSLELGLQRDTGGSVTGLQITLGGHERDASRLHWHMPAAAALARTASICVS